MDGDNFNEIEEAVYIALELAGYPRAELDEEELGSDDEDCYIYNDYTKKVQVVITLVDGVAQTKIISMDDVQRRMKEEWAGAVAEYEADKALMALSICPDCGCAFDEDGQCECPESPRPFLRDRWSADDQEPLRL